MDSSFKVRLYFLLQRLFRGLLWLIGGYRFEGLEHMPRQGPVLVVANHLNNLDPLLIQAALPRLVVWLAKIELFRVPGLAQLLRYYWTIPIDRGAADRQAMKAALDWLAAGQVLGIFPEGTRSRTAAMQRGHLGVGLLAVRSGAPVLPVAVIGSERPLRRWPRPSLIVRVGRPLRIERPAGGRADYQAITDQIMFEIAGLVPPAYRGVYAQPPTPLTGDGRADQPPAGGPERQEGVARESGAGR